MMIIMRWDWWRICYFPALFPGRTTTKEARQAALHTLHLLLARLLLLGRHLGEPLLAILADLLLHHLVVLLPVLPDLVPEHLALFQAVGRRPLAVQRAARLQAQHRRQGANAPAGALRLLLCQLLLEFLSHDLLAFGEFGGDVGSFEGLEDGPHVLDTHSSNVLQEGDQSDQGFVLGVTLPFRENDGILWLFPGVSCYGIDEDDFRKVSV
jgi:hypothetical protein